MSFSEAAESLWLQTEIIPKLLKQQKLIENFGDNDFEHFQIVKCDIKVVGLEEAFMLTACYRAAIEYKFKDLTNRLQFFVKKTPELPQDIFDSVSFTALFSNEVLAYKKLMPALQEFAKVDFKIVKFYYADVQNNFAAVITEDFTHQHWTMCKQTVNISLEHILLSVKYLAEFHAAGFAWRHQKPKQFEELTKDLKEARFANDPHPQWAICLRECKRRALLATRKYQPCVKKDFLDRLSQLWGDLHNYGKKIVQPQEPLVTLCHGDFLRNNVAFQYDESGHPINVMMFDLQTFRVSSPMIDLATFLSLASYAEVRYKHFPEIFTLYSETLQTSYKRLVAEPLPNYLSYKSLLKEYTRILPYSIYICSAFLMNLVEPKNETAEELLMAQPTEEEVIQRVMTRGGEEVDRELAHQIKELHELVEANEANDFEGF